MEMQDPRYAPGMIFNVDELEDPDFLPNPRRGRRRGRKRGRSRTRKRSRKNPARRRSTRRRPSKRRGRRRARRNPRFGRHRPVLIYGKGRWRAPRRSRMGIRGYRVNRRRGRGRRRVRRNPRIFSSRKFKVALPKKGDFSKRNLWKALGGFIGNTIITNATGLLWNIAWEAKIGTMIKVNAKWKPYIRDASRILIKTGVGLGTAYALGKATKNDVVMKFATLGTVLAVVLDIVGTIAKYVIGWKSPFSESTIVMPAFMGTSGKNQALMAGAHLAGFGAMHEAYHHRKVLMGAHSPQGMKVLQGPDGSLHLVHPQAGIIQSGNEHAVIGTYHRLMGAHFSGLARRSGFGEMMSIESGVPYRGDTSNDY